MKINNSQTLILLIASFIVIMSISGYSSESTQVNKIPVNIYKIDKIAPVDNCFTGRVEPLETTTLSFGVSGVIEKIKDEEEIVFPSVNNKKGEIVYPGTVISTLRKGPFIMSQEIAESAVQIAQNNYNDALQDFERDKKLVEKGLISKKEYQKAESAYLTAKINYTKTKIDYKKALWEMEHSELHSPFMGVISAVLRGKNMGVGAADPIVKITRMDLLVVKIPFDSELISNIGKNDVVLVYSPIIDDPSCGWLNKDTNQPTMLNAVIGNKIISSELTPEQKKMKKTHLIIPVVNIIGKYEKAESLTESQVNAIPSQLSVPVQALQHDEKGTYVLKAVGQKAADEKKGIDKEFTVKKVYVKEGDIEKYLSLGALGGIDIVSLVDSGELKVLDVVLVNSDPGINDGDKVVYDELRWLFYPGFDVQVEIPALSGTGFYVPDQYIIKRSPGSNYVYINDNEKARLVRVKLTGMGSSFINGIAYKVESPEITEGTYIIALDDTLVSQLYDGADVEVKGVAPSISKRIQSHHVQPIIPYENLKKIITFE